MNLGRGLEKTSLAACILASGTGDLRGRLLQAYREMADLGPGEYPESVSDDMAALNHRLTRVPGNEGSIAATIKTMDEDELQVTARTIVGLYGDISREVGRRERR